MLIYTPLLLTLIWNTSLKFRYFSRDFILVLTVTDSRVLEEAYWNTCLLGDKGL